MTKNIFGSFLVFGFLSLVFSCDVIDTPIDQTAQAASVDTVFDENVGMTYSELESYTWDTITSSSNRNKQFILLEEYTGHTCPNCPPGTKEMLRLDSIYGEQLVVVSIHLGNYALPENKPDGSFSTDHRVPEIIEGNYLNKMNISAFPNGLVQRNGIVDLYKRWEQTILAIKDNSPKAVVQVKNLYNPQLGIARTIVNYEWLETLAEDYNIQVFLKEDHVVDWQINITYNEPNYDHRHILKKVVNKLFGVPAKEAVEGVEGRKEYIYKADPSWDMQNVSVIAFLYKSQAPYNVVQVNEAAVVK